ILEGLEYPSVEREHRALKASGRVEYGRVTLEETKRAIQDFSRLEGIIPAIQTAQVIAWAAQAAARLPKDQAVVVNMTERVDKDIWDIGKALGMQF
ncbi:MAG: tryptophan synthase subunit beta, partial [Sinobacteraceae bacterium]|nr:tryptophan synthase subunit beta [Nevskiaceae bacterium]